MNEKFDVNFLGWHAFLIEITHLKQSEYLKLFRI